MAAIKEIDHSSLLSEDISRLFLDDRLSDVVFVVQGKQIAAHKIVLAARSNVFRNQLFEQTALTACKREIHINDCSALCFKNFIKYIYTGKISLINMDDVESRELLALALKYEIKCLVETILEPTSESMSLRQKTTVKSQPVAGGQSQTTISQTSKSLLFQFEDIANLEKGAQVIEGQNPERLFSGKRDLDEKSLTKHKIETNSKGIIIKLNIPVLLNIIRFRLCDIDAKRCYSYYIQVSEDALSWQLVADYQYYSCRSWQTIFFGQRLVQYIQIVGTYSNEKTFFSNTRYFSIISLLCGLSKKSTKLTNGFWEPESNIATINKGAIVVINGSDFCRNAKMINDYIDFEYKKFNHICSEFKFDVDSHLIVLLPQPIVTSSIGFFIYGEQKFKYRVKVSVDSMEKEPKKWTVVADRRDKYNASKWQRITFNKCVVSIICIDQIRCINESVTTFPVMTFNCP